MNPPQVYTCSQSRNLLPPPSPHHPSGSSQCTSPKHPAPCIEPRLVIRFLHDIIHVSWDSKRDKEINNPKKTRERTLMLGGIEGRRRRGWQRTRWMDGIADLMDMNLLRVYILSHSWNPLPPHTISLGYPSDPAPSILYPASNLDWRFISFFFFFFWRFISYMIFIHVNAIQMSQLSAWGGQSIGVLASASVLPMHTQDWSP